MVKQKALIAKESRARHELRYIEIINRIMKDGEIKDEHDVEFLNKNEARLHAILPRPKNRIE